MIRRDFFRQSLFAAGSAYTVGRAPLAPLQAVAQDVPALDVTRYVSQFIVETEFEEIPEDAMANGKKHVLDGFGLAVSGSASEMGPRMRQYLRTLGFEGGTASVIGSAMKVPAGFAALANGVSIHAHDFDDTGGNGHPTVTVLPPAFALSEAGRRSGRDLLLAYHIGVEVESRLAAAVAGDNNAFHGTPLYGSFGSAAACARLRGLDATQTANALGIVATRGAGLRANFGTMTKPLQVGSASSAGVEAAELASLGWTAATDIIEAPLGFFKATGGQVNADAVLNRLGRPWAFSTGFTIKRFPCGAIQQAVMEEVLRVATRIDLRADDVEKVEVGGTAGTVTTLFRHRPTTGLHAKFSMEFAVSILILDRQAGLTQFSDEVVRRRDVQDLVRRVTFSADVDAAREGFSLKIYLRDGTVLSSRAPPARGHVRNPMSYEEVAAKFRENAAYARWPAAKTESVIDLVRSLDRVADMGGLTAALTV